MVSRFASLRYHDPMVPKIAISYRRSDSQDITGQIFDRLRQHFGKDSVFRDIDNIRPGIDFRVQISEALRTTDVLLVVVGPKWFGRAKGADSRIDNKADPVRIEVETALQRDIPVIPVLVGNTKMPTTAQLPDGLKDFAYRHAVTVDGGRDFDHHLEGLIRALDGILDIKVDVANSKPASDEQPIRPKQPFGVVATNTADAIPAGSPAKLQPSDHSPNGSFGNVADYVEPSSATLQTETLKSKKPNSAGLARLIWPERPIGRLLRVGLVVLVVGLAAAAILKVQVAENAHRAAETQLEDARKAAEAKAAEDARKAAEAKTAEEARKAADAKAVEDARKAAETKTAEDARRRPKQRPPRMLGRRPKRKPPRMPARRPQRKQPRTLAKSPTQSPTWIPFARRPKPGTWMPWSRSRLGTSTTKGVPTIMRRPCVGGNEPPIPETLVRCG